MLRLPISEFEYFCFLKAHLWGELGHVRLISPGAQCLHFLGFQCNRSKETTKKRDCDVTLTNGSVHFVLSCFHKHCPSFPLHPLPLWALPREYQLLEATSQLSRLTVPTEGHSPLLWTWFVSAPFTCSLTAGHHTYPVLLDTAEVMLGISNLKTALHTHTHTIKSRQENQASPTHRLTFKPAPPSSQTPWSFRSKSQASHNSSINTQAHIAERSELVKSIIALP